MAENKNTIIMTALEERIVSLEKEIKEIRGDGVQYRVERLVEKCIEMGKLQAYLENMKG